MSYIYLSINEERLFHYTIICKFWNSPKENKKKLIIEEFPNFNFFLDKYTTKEGKETKGFLFPNNTHQVACMLS